MGRYTTARSFDDRSTEVHLEHDEFVCNYLALLLTARVGPSSSD
jgi:hypothetical protein